MNIKSQCLSCMLRQMESIVERIEPDQPKQLVLIRTLMKYIAESDIHVPAPFIARNLYAGLARLTGQKDPFADLKKQSNKLVQKSVIRIKEMIDASDDVFCSALKASIAGNIIDFGVQCSQNAHAIETECERVLSQPLSVEPETYQIFLDDILSAKKILYLCDNAGEIALDALFMEYLPDDKVTCAVRGYPVINDATMIDAEAVGLSQKVKVISTGDSTPGINFEHSSLEFTSAFADADLIIAKGQGNYETLSPLGQRVSVKDDAHIYSLLKIKCQPVAEDLAKKIGETVVVRLK